MSGRHFSRQLSAMHQDKVSCFCIFLTGLPGCIMIEWNQVFMRIVFEMITYCNGIQAIAYCLIDPYSGPYIPVGKHCVHVQIAFDRDKPRDIGKIQDFSLSVSKKGGY